MKLARKRNLGRSCKAHGGGFGAGSTHHPTGQAFRPVSGFPVSPYTKNSIHLASPIDWSMLSYFLSQ